MKIDIPGEPLDESHVDLVPPAMLHACELAINLQGWLAWAEEKKLVTTSWGPGSVAVTQKGQSVTMVISDVGTRIVTRGEFGQDGAWFFPPPGSPNSSAPVSTPICLTTPSNFCFPMRRAQIDGIQ